jgi:hypothetical protein
VLRENSISGSWSLSPSDPSILYQIPIPSLKFRRSSVADDPSGSTDGQNQVHEIIRDFKPRIEEALTSASCENESQVSELSTPLPEPRIREQSMKRRREEVSNDDDFTPPPARKASPFASP